MTQPCSRCNGPRDRANQRYCRTCAAAYKRERAKRGARAIHLVEKFGLSLGEEPTAAGGALKATVEPGVSTGK